MEKSSDDLVKVFVGGSAIEAHFVRDLLESEGIRATVLGEMLDVARGDIPFTTETMPAVWVRQDEAAQAKAIVAEFDRRQKFGGEHGVKPASWVCPQCGKKIEGQFDQCWNCQTMREGE